MDTSVTAVLSKLRGGHEPKKAEKQDIVVNVIEESPEPRPKIVKKITTSWKKLQQNTFLYPLVKILIILTAGIFVFTFLRRVLQPLLLQRVEKRVTRKDKEKQNNNMEKSVVAVANEIEQNTERESTLVRAIISFVNAVILIITIIASLSVLGVQSTALITAAGVGSLVVGLAAQSLLKDLLNGLIILIENEFNINDVVDVNTIHGNTYNGSIVSLAVLKTTLQRFDNSIVYIPNGSIASVTNYSQDSQRALVEISIAYDSNVETVFAAFQDMCVSLRTSPEISRFLVSGPSVMGILETKPQNYTLGVAAFVKHGKQWETERFLRYSSLRILEALNLKGTVNFVNASPPKPLKINVPSRQTQIEAVLGKHVNIEGNVP